MGIVLCRWIIHIKLDIQLDIAGVWLAHTFPSAKHLRIKPPQNIMIPQYLFGKKILILFNVRPHSEKKSKFVKAGLMWPG